MDPSSREAADVSEANTLVQDVEAWLGKHSPRSAEGAYASEASAPRPLVGDERLMHRARMHEEAMTCMEREIAAFLAPPSPASGEAEALVGRIDTVSRYYGSAHPMVKELLRDLRSFITRPQPAGAACDASHTPPAAASVETLKNLSERAEGWAKYADGENKALWESDRYRAIQYGGLAGVIRDLLDRARSAEGANAREASAPAQAQADGREGE